ncbi:hypothetical protein LTR08_003645 [Meristemomyces frigidus]|nr:hypothetical protein LTR08_003645 [Meristemomyces frigidus]
MLLRDSCCCPLCVDPSTKQKLFSTTDIPATIGGTASSSDDEEFCTLRWTDDVPGFPDDHVTTLPKDMLREFVTTGGPVASPKPSERVTWSPDRFRRDVQDVEYEAYMSDDSVLHQALQKLHTHGLLFLTNVPESESSVSAVAERIGPLKNTFYGSTWDVRSVPQAKNVAYTSQDLAYHMDLLYMKQPPHLQFLHCIRSSSAGGASLFTDSLRAASDLFISDMEAFTNLSKTPVNFHYDHPESQYYHHQRPVFEMRDPLFLGLCRARNLREMVNIAETRLGIMQRDLDITRWIDAVSWSPPFQAPFSILSANDPSGVIRLATERPTDVLSYHLRQWHAAASKFHQLIRRPQMTYERMMKPGECVLFDNRRVLHARKAFEVGDVGKERWLRGAYLDKDPYESKMRMLRERFTTKVGGGKLEIADDAAHKFFEAAETHT